MTNKLTRRNWMPNLWQEDPDLFISPIERHFQGMLDNFFGDDWLAGSDSFKNIFDKNSYPKVNIIDRDKEVVVEAEIPGLDKEDVSVSVSHNCLIIKGNKKEQTSDKKDNYLRRELKHSSFSRCVGELGENINKKDISAEFKNGILTITLKKIEATPKKEESFNIVIK